VCEDTLESDGCVYGIDHGDGFASIHGAPTLQSLYNKYTQPFKLSIIV
jgi:hypothetical protein